MITAKQCWAHRSLCCLGATAVGAAFGTSKSGIGIAGLGGFRPELIMKVRPIVHVAEL